MLLLCDPRRDAARCGNRKTTHRGERRRRADEEEKKRKNVHPRYEIAKCHAVNNLKRRLVPSRAWFYCRFFLFFVRRVIRPLGRRKTL